MAKPKVAIVRHKERITDEASYNALKPEAIKGTLQEAVKLAGGLPVQRGDVVLLKPNSNAGAPVQAKGQIPDPKTLWALAKLCFEAGAKKVIVADHAFRGSWSWNMLKANTMEDWAKKAGATVLYWEKEPYIYLESPSNWYIKRWAWPKSAVDCDVMIGLARPKTHLFGVYTGVIKNLYGLCRSEYKNVFHNEDWNQKIIDMASIFKDKYRFVINDALAFGEGQGPLAGVTPVYKGLIIASADPLACDCVTSYIMGIGPHEVDYLRSARDRLGDIWTYDEPPFEKIQILGEDPEKVKFAARRAVLRVFRGGMYPKFVKVYAGGACAGCQGWAGAIWDGWAMDGTFEKLRDSYKEKYGKDEIVVITGFNVHVPEVDYERLHETSVVFVCGDCAPERYRKDPRNYFIPGCSPGMEVLEVMFKAAGWPLPTGLWFHVPWPPDPETAHYW